MSEQSEKPANPFCMTNANRRRPGGPLNERILEVNKAVYEDVEIEAVDLPKPTESES